MRSAGGLTWSTPDPDDPPQAPASSDHIQKIENNGFIVIRNPASVCTHRTLRILLVGAQYMLLFRSPQHRISFEWPENPPARLMNNSVAVRQNSSSQ